MTYIDNTQSRLEEQFDNLYRASRWEKEWRDIMAHPRQTQQGTLLWAEVKSLFGLEPYGGQTTIGLHKQDMLTIWQRWQRPKHCEMGLFRCSCYHPIHCSDRADNS